MRPTYQNMSEIVKYVLIAKKSQTSGDRKLIHRDPRVFGYGNIQNASQGRPMWMRGNSPAHMTANSVIASAARFTDVRQGWGRGERGGGGGGGGGGGPGPKNKK